MEMKIHELFLFALIMKQKHQSHFLIGRFVFKIVDHSCSINLCALCTYNITVMIIFVINLICHIQVNSLFSPSDEINIVR